MSIGLFGGLGLFLYGMDLMANTLKVVAGERMRDILDRLTGNRFMGVATGALVAAEPNRLPAYTIEIDIIEKLKRIYYFAKRMAKTVEPGPAAGGE